MINVSCTGAGEAVSIETLLAGAAVRARSVDTVSVGVAAVVLCGAFVQIYTHGHIHATGLALMEKLETKGSS